MVTLSLVIFHITFDRFDAILARDQTPRTPVPLVVENGPSSSPDRYNPVSSVDGTLPILRPVVEVRCDLASANTRISGDVSSLNALSTAAISESLARILIPQHPLLELPYRY